MLKYLFIPLVLSVFISKISLSKDCVEVFTNDNLNLKQDKTSFQITQGEVHYMINKYKSGLLTFRKMLSGFLKTDKEFFINNGAFYSSSKIHYLIYNFMKAQKDNLGKEISVGDTQQIYYETPDNNILIMDSSYNGIITFIPTSKFKLEGSYFFVKEEGYLFLLTKTKYNTSGVFDLVTGSLLVYSNKKITKKDVPQMLNLVVESTNKLKLPIALFLINNSSFFVNVDNDTINVFDSEGNYIVKLQSKKENMLPDDIKLLLEEYLNNITYEKPIIPSESIKEADELVQKFQDTEINKILNTFLIIREEEQGKILDFAKTSFVAFNLPSGDILITDKDKKLIVSIVPLSLFGFSKSYYVKNKDEFFILGKSKESSGLFDPLTGTLQVYCNKTICQKVAYRKVENLKSFLQKYNIKSSLITIEDKEFYVTPTLNDKINVFNSNGELVTKINIIKELSYKEITDLVIKNLSIETNNNIKIKRRIGFLGIDEVNEEPLVKTSKIGFLK